jgi:hypothetical protein
LVGDSALFTSCIVARKQVIREAGLFDKHFISAEDFDLWLRVAHLGGEIALLRKALGRRRIHPDALTAADTQIQLDTLSVLKKLEQTLQLTPAASSLLRQRLTRDQAYVNLVKAKRLLQSGRSDEAKEALTSAYVFFRTKKLRVTLLGLQVAPRVTVLAAKIWERYLQEIRRPRANK